jgi:glyoxylase-like metal-dependent hydrolase (beta-lactamase superfamily II)
MASATLPLRNSDLAPRVSCSRMGAAVGEILTGLWRFEALHPEWTEEEGGEEGWERTVGWWALTSLDGMLLIDPLVIGWTELDALVEEHGGCAGVVRTVHWHQRSVAEAAARYGASVWAKSPPPDDGEGPAFDRELREGTEQLDGLRAFGVERGDEIAVWLPKQVALLFGDAMLRRPSGELRVCPDSWRQPQGGPARLRAVLSQFLELPVEHVLVAHGPLVLGDGTAALRAALGER